jgi:hypothetical protein
MVAPQALVCGLATSGDRWPLSIIMVRFCRTAAMCGPGAPPGQGSIRNRPSVAKTIDAAPFASGWVVLPRCHRPPLASLSWNPELKVASTRLSAAPVRWSGPVHGCPGYRIPGKSWNLTRCGSIQTTSARYEVWETSGRTNATLAAAAPCTRIRSCKMLRWLHDLA